MIDRVTDEMREWVTDHLDHFAVEFDIAALDVDQNLLSELIREVSCKPGDGAEKSLDALHSHSSDGVADVREDRCEPFKRTINRGLGAGLTQAMRKIVGAFEARAKDLYG